MRSFNFRVNFLLLLLGFVQTWSLGLFLSLYSGIAISAEGKNLPALIAARPGTTLLGVSGALGMQLEATDGQLDVDGDAWGKGFNIAAAELNFTGAVFPATDITVRLIEEEWMLTLDQMYLSVDLGAFSPQMDRVTLHAGRQPIPFGLQAQTKTLDLLRGGRAYAVYLGSPYLALDGVQIEGSRNYVVWQAGLFVDSEVDAGAEAPISFSGRVASRNRETSDLIVQMGLSYNHQSLLNDTSWYIDERYISSGIFDDSLISPYKIYSSGNGLGVSQDRRVGWDALIQRKSFSLQWEVIQREITSENSASSAFFGGYAEVAWLMNGARRHYDDQRGILVAPKPKGAWGSFEWFAGFEAMNFKKEISASKDDLRTYFIGHNWYANPNMKVSVQWQYVNADPSFIRSETTEQTGRGILLGLQLSI